MSGRSIVESNNFLFLDFSYMSTYNVTRLRTVFGRMLFSLFDKQDGKNRFREFKRNLIQLNSFLQSTKPSLVFVDEHLSHYYAYIKNKLSNVYILNTKLPSGKYRGVPPLNNSYLPLRNSVFNVVLCELLWSKIIIKKLFYRLVNRIAYLGLTTEEFHDRFVLRSKQPINFTIKTCFPDYDKPIDAPTIMLMSERFNFPWKEHDSFEYFYHSWNIDSSPMEDSLARNVDNVKGKKKIIYCGIGTMPGKSIDEYARFFVQLLKVAKSNKEFVFILSTAVPQITSMLKTIGIPEHVFVYDRVAQQAVLKHCDVMITHGGLNSVKECIFNSVPMLGVCNPAHHHTDTLGNIVRLVYHKIGLRCSIKDSAYMLQQQIEILAHSDIFKNNIIALKDKMSQYQSPFFKEGVFHLENY